MILKGKNVSLKLIQQEDIELIRSWRNSKDVNQFFLFRGYISKSKQKKWFVKKSTSGKDYYFLIVIDNEPVGLIYTKNVDWVLREGENGIFIAKKEYRNSLIPFEASYILNRHIFYKLNLKKVKSQVLESNKRSLNYNKEIGYKEIGKKKVEIDGEICNVVLLEKTRNDFDKWAKKRARLLSLIQ